MLPIIGAREVVATTLRIPHPYTFEDAVNFLKTRNGSAALWRFRNLEHRHAELGYWIGVPFWGNGSCTEAARAALEYDFNTLQLHRIHSGQNLRKLA